jgi:hypothetical protein
MSPQYLHELQLAAFAKKIRIKAGKTPTEAARELKVSQPSIHNAEENPQKSYTKLRRRIIETYSDFKVSGPFYELSKGKR